MDRVQAYPGQGISETDILNTNKNALLGLAKLAAAIIGTGPALHSLPCTPGTGLSVQIGAGQIYQQGALDANGYSSLGTDSHTVLKQGILLDPVTLNLAAPTTAGQSINYLIEFQQQDVDGGATVLPFYNASNPGQTYQGPGGNGQASYTVRAGKCAVQAKAGTPAATGTQTTPAVDSGWVAAYVVTVDYGATSIASGKITTASGAPFLTQTLAGLGSNAALLNAANVFTQPQTAPAATTGGQLTTAAQIQSNALDYGQDTGTANTYQVAYTPAITTLTGGMILTFKAANANTGAATFSPNGMTAAPILGGAHQALQGGEIVAAGKVELIYHAALGAWVLLGATGGATQVGNATQSQQAPTAAQIQSNALDYGQDAGTANTYQVVYTPAITGLVGGMILTFKAANANTSAATFAPNGLAAKPILGGAHQALQGGEIVAGGKVELIYHAALASWILLGCTGGAVQVGNATQSQQAVPYGQVQNLVAAASAAYLSGAATLSAGKYLVDTSGGPITLTLPASPAAGTIIELIDAAATWNRSNCTLSRNGKTIEGLAEDLVLNVNDQRFIIWFNGSDWRLL